MKKIFFSFLIVLTINQSEAGKQPDSTQLIEFQEALKNINKKKHDSIIQQCLKAEQNPLHTAVLAQNPKAVEILCKEHPEYINQQDKKGNTPLNLRRIGFKDYQEYSTKQQNLRARIQQLLLHYAADVNIKNRAGDSPIFRAFDLFHEWNGYAQIGLSDSERAIANAYLEIGKPDFKQLGSHNNTLLHFTITRSNLETAELTLKAISKHPKQERETIFSTRRGSDNLSIYDLATFDETTPEMKNLLTHYLSAHKALSK